MWARLIITDNNFNTISYKHTNTNTVQLYKCSLPHTISYVPSSHSLNTTHVWQNLVMYNSKWLPTSWCSTLPYPPLSWSSCPGHWTSVEGRPLAASLGSAHNRGHTHQSLYHAHTHTHTHTHTHAYTHIHTPVTHRNREQVYNLAT